MVAVYLPPYIDARAGRGKAKITFMWNVEGLMPLHRKLHRVKFVFVLSTSPMPSIAYN